MVTHLRDEIRQTQPFASAEQEAFLSLARTWSVLDHGIAEVLKPHGITATQYNVLRILRGAGDEGLCRNEVMERMVARVPDATRMLNRLESAGLIVRERDATDRRFVTTRISEAGARLLADLDGVIQETHRRQFAMLEEEELDRLLELLARVREQES